MFPVFIKWIPPSFIFLNPYMFTLKNFLPDILNNFFRLQQYAFSLSHGYCSRKHRQLSCYLFLIFPAGRNNVFYKPFHFYRNQAMNAALSKEKYSQIIFSLRLSLQNLMEKANNICLQHVHVKYFLRRAGSLCFVVILRKARVLIFYFPLFPAAFLCENQ